MKRAFLTLLAIILLLVGLYERPISTATPVSQLQPAPKTRAIDLPWPTVGQAALGARGYGLLTSHGTGSPLPIASVAKIITALAVLQKKPIVAGNQGPLITLTPQDVDSFNYYYLNDGSVAQVQAGEQLTEYQALQAMLLPSANNFADTLANWAFGSMNAYTAYANQMVKSMGLNQTTVGGASGFTNNTTSTAADMVKLALAAIGDPAIASIVKQQSATIPVAGTIKNVNWLLGQDGVVGIKTGNTDEAGGCYLFAAQRSVLGHQITLVGAVLGDTDLTSAIRQADTLIKASDTGFERLTIVKKGQTQATINTPWGASAPIRPAKDLTLLVWKGQEIKISDQLQPVRAPARTGDTMGKITTASGQQSATTQLVLGDNLAGPSWHWRLFHR